MRQWVVWRLEITEGRRPPRQYHHTVSSMHQYYRMDPIHFGSTLQPPHSHGWRTEQHLHPPYPSHCKHNSRIPPHQIVHGHPQSIRRSPRQMHFHHNNRLLKTMFPYPQTSILNRIPGLSPLLILFPLTYNLLLMLRLPNHLQIDIDATTVELKHLGLSHRILPSKVVRLCPQDLAWQQLATSTPIQRKAVALPLSLHIVKHHRQPSTTTILPHSQDLLAKMT